MFNYQPYVPEVNTVHIQKGEDESNLCGSPIGKRVTSLLDNVALCPECSNIRSERDSIDIDWFEKLFKELSNG